MRPRTDDSHERLRRTALACIVLLGLGTIVSCGGGASSTVVVDPIVINGHTVPAEPEPAANGSTVAGVDSNSNGVRDDVERKLAEVGPDKAAYQSLLSIAREQQRLLTIPVPADREKALQEVAKLYCAISKSTDLPGIGLLELIVDTPDRLAAYTAFYDVLGGVDSSEIPPCAR